MTQAAVKEGKVMCRCHFNDCGTLMQLAHRLLAVLLHNEEYLLQLKNFATAHNGRSAMHVKELIRNHVLRYGESDYPLSTIYVKFRYIDAVTPFKFTCFAAQNSVGGESLLQFGETTLAGKAVQMLVPVGNPSARGIVKLLDANPPLCFDDYCKSAEYQVGLRFQDGTWSELT